MRLCVQCVRLLKLVSKCKCCLGLRVADCSITPFVVSVSSRCYVQVEVNDHIINAQYPCDLCTGKHERQCNDDWRQSGRNDLRRSRAEVGVATFRKVPLVVAKLPRTRTIIQLYR